MKRRVIEFVAERPRQVTSVELVNGLLRNIREQFCGDLSDKEWFQVHEGFIRRNVVLWPAGFMRGKGFTVSAERYRGIMLGILLEIKQYGCSSRTGKGPEVVRYWPGYLMRCVQEHWRHHWEVYYQEAKAVRAQAEAALLAARGACARLPGEAPMVDVVEQLAVARGLMSRGGGRRGVRVKKEQGELGL